MDFDTAVKILNRQLRREKPETFSSTWIFANAQPVYHYIRNNFRTTSGEIDWDTITVALHRPYQKRWIRYRCRRISLYDDRAEVERVLSRYRNKLYTFIAPVDHEDRMIRNTICLSFF